MRIQSIIDYFSVRSRLHCRDFVGAADPTARKLKARTIQRRALVNYNRGRRLMMRMMRPTLSSDADRP